MCPPYDRSLELRLSVVHNVLEDSPQRNWDGQKDKNPSDEPGFTVSPNLVKKKQTEKTVSTILQTWKQAKAYLVLLQLPDAEGQHSYQKEAVKNQNQRADPPSPLCPRARHDGSGGHAKNPHSWRSAHLDTSR